MMILRLLMAALRKVPSGELDSVTSPGTRIKSVGAPLTAIHPNSSPVYKSQSETALTEGLSKLTINNKSRPIPKRTLSGCTSANGSVKNVADAGRLLQNGTVQNVVIVAGAGISTPSGIPDFRSPGTGLYDNLQQYNIPYPEAIFDIDYFFVNPRPFFTLAKELYPSGKYRPNYIHYFAKLLYDKGLLLRMYTQNIDGLERLAGVPAEKLVEAHGTFATATCTICRHKMEGYEIKEKIFTDKLPRCPTRGCVGIVKPDIVFFGEDLPRKFYSYMKDMLQADLVLVMGTSLEVQPFAGIIDTVRFNVPRVLFNREAVGPFKYSKRAQDVIATGDLINSMMKFATQIGWKDDMVQLITKEEGQFIIETRKPLPPKGPPKHKPPPGRQLNKPPMGQTNQNKTTNYNRGMFRERARFDLYYSESSSAESTESDSDVTSSDSSEEETRNSRFRGLNRRKLLNSNIRNGAIKSNGERSTSAKPNGTNNKRELHTQRKAGNDSPGSLTGRSVKSESAINATLTKRRLDIMKNVTSMETKTRPEYVIPQPKSDIAPVVEKQKVQLVERDRVLRKYGLGSQPNIKISKPFNNLAYEVSVPDVTKTAERTANTDTAAKTSIKRRAITENATKIPIEKTNSTVNLTQRPVEKTSSSVNLTKTPIERPTSTINITQRPVDITTSVNVTKTPIARTSSTVNLTKTPIERRVFMENITSPLERRNFADISKLQVDRRTTADTDITTPGENKMKTLKTVKSDSAIACTSYFVEDFRKEVKMDAFEDVNKKPITDAFENSKMVETNTLSDASRIAEMDAYVSDEIETLRKQRNARHIDIDARHIDSVEHNAMLELETDNRKIVEHHSWKKETASRDKVLHLLDKKVKFKGEVESCDSSIVSTCRTGNRNEKGLKILSDKAAKSFTKYANLIPQKRVGKKHSKKKHRITSKDRPSLGSKSTTAKTQLRSVNTRPYGYAHRQTNLVKGVGPFNRTNKRTLNSAIDHTNCYQTVRSGSADLPKITYQHHIQATPTYDAEVFSSPLASPIEEADSSENIR